MTDADQDILSLLRRFLDQKADAGKPLSDEDFVGTRFAALDLDSLEKMEMVMEIEDQFEIVLDEEDILACEKISDLVALMKRAA